MTPVQPYFVFATYQYHKKLVLRNGIAHIYNYQQNCEEFETTSAIPDGCVDIYFEKNSSGVHARACGTVLQRTDLANQKDNEYFGIRFMPGVLPANLSVEMKDLISHEIDLAEVVRNRDLPQRIEETQDWKECIRLFLNDYLASLQSAPPEAGETSQKRLAEYSKGMMLSTGGAIQIQELAELTGYSARYINMVFDRYLGMGPKTFAKIMQFQNAIQLINHHQEDQLTKVGMEAGYFDQAHFIREFKKHSAMTPAEYRRLVKEHSYLQRLTIDPS